jgi:hypothetical protein
MSHSPFSISRDFKWFNLGTIISVSFSLPMISIGQQLAVLYGMSAAVSSVIIGNLFLWLIGLTVISMSSEDRSNSIENAKNYLGKCGAVFMWLILVFSIIHWFVYQISSVIPSISNYFQKDIQQINLLLGLSFGVFTTLISMGGVNIIKRVTIFSFPFILLYYIYSVSEHKPLADYPISSSIPLPGVISTISLLLPGVINLPTIFRHAHSKADSHLGLSIMVILISLFECATIWMNFNENFEIIYPKTESPLFSFFTLIFISTTLVFINLLNIYYASACWETYIPRFKGINGYLIIGLLGTFFYFLMETYVLTDFFGLLTDSYLASLGAVLVVSYLMRIFLKHRPRRFEQKLNMICWISGCMSSTYLLLKNPSSITDSLLMGIFASLVVFLCILFVEQSIWSAKKLLFRNIKP